jgi:hypothetical protein
MMMEPNVYINSSLLISPDRSTSVSLNKVVVNSVTLSSESNDGDCSRKQRSNNFISIKLITPLPIKSV